MGVKWDPSRPTLAERAERMRAQAAGKGASRGVHVWVTQDGRRVLGLLAGWDRRPDGWWGSVAVIDQAGGLVEMSIHQRWLIKATESGAPS